MRLQARGGEWVVTTERKEQLYCDGLAGRVSLKGPVDLEHVGLDCRKEPTRQQTHQVRIVVASVPLILMERKSIWSFRVILASADQIVQYLRLHPMTSMDMPQKELCRNSMNPVQQHPRSLITLTISLMLPWMFPTRAHACFLQQCYLDCLEDEVNMPAASSCCACSLLTKPCKAMISTIATKLQLLKD